MADKDKLKLLAAVMVALLIGYKIGIRPTQNVFMVDNLVSPTVGPMGTALVLQQANTVKFCQVATGICFTQQLTDHETHAALEDIRDKMDAAGNTP